MLRRQLADALKGRKGSVSSSGIGTGTIGSFDDSGFFDILGRGRSGSDEAIANALRDQLAESERLVQEMSLSWEQRVQMSEAFAKVRSHSKLLLPLGGDGLLPSFLCFCFFYSVAVNFATTKSILTCSIENYPTFCNI